jgi:malonyl-CoA O-methyltransferase
MIWQAIHNKVRKAFSDAAMNYEMLSSLHKEIGRELVRKVMHQDAARVLDVGTGTGYLANKAKFYFPESLVVGVDLADGMVLEANKLKEGIQIVQADACALPFKKGAFDLVISNLAYQWVADLPHAFGVAHQALSDRGRMCATLFGRRTLEELFECVNAVSPGKPVNRLPDMDKVRSALELAGFKNIAIDYELIKVQFADVFDLLKWTKSIGANILNEDIFLGPKTLGKLDEHYKKSYPYADGVCASFEVIWMLADKNPGAVNHA